MNTRIKIWEKLAGDWKLSHLAELSSEISLDDLDENIELILQGKKKGRTVVTLT
jgi:hypothetical protein